MIVQLNKDFEVKLLEAFSDELKQLPEVSLRGGNALDNGCNLLDYDEVLDLVSDEYFEKYFWGVSYLDSTSWRYYLPLLIHYSLRQFEEANTVTDALLQSLRPPDRTPPRLGSLSKLQEQVIVEFLEFLAFNDESAYQEFSCQVLDEWWYSRSLYRT